MLEVVLVVGLGDVLEADELHGFTRPDDNTAGLDRAKRTHECAAARERNRGSNAHSLAHVAPEMVRATQAPVDPG
mgnify:CR=1 FL=1